MAGMQVAIPQDDRYELGGRAPKAFTGGTHRTALPRETLTRVEPFFRELGITRVANVTGLDKIGIPVVSVMRPNARSLSVFQGKGISLDAAKASGVMEAIESHHAETIERPLRLARYSELSRSVRVIDLEKLPARRSQPFDAEAPILWIEGYDIVGREPVWLPYDVVHADYTLTHCLRSARFALTSIGLASGNHLLEAVSHAVCEVIECDAVNLWRLAEAADRDAAHVRLDSINDVLITDLLERFERASLGVGVWEVTSEVGVATFVCRIVERDPDVFNPRFLFEGSGCHPVPEIALIRAVTEAAQSRLTYIVGSRDDLTREEYEVAVSYVSRSRRAQILMEQEARRDFADAPSFEAGTIDEDVSWQVERLRSAGVEEVVVVDLTKRELSIPVARVVIPGLESAPFETVASSRLVPGGRGEALREARS